MKKFVKDITLILLSGLLVGQIHSVIGWIYPDTRQITYCLWLGDYKEEITVAYYLYELENILAWVIWFYAFAKSVQLISYQLFSIVFVFVLYFITQLVLYVWNRNSSIISNLIIYLYMGIAIRLLLVPTKKKGGKLINLEDY